MAKRNKKDEEELDQPVPAMGEFQGPETAEQMAARQAAKGVGNDWANPANVVPERNIEGSTPASKALENWGQMTSNMGDTLGTAATAVKDTLGGIGDAYKSAIPSTEPRFNSGYPALPQSNLPAVGQPLIPGTPDYSRELAKGQGEQRMLEGQKPNYTEPKFDTTPKDINSKSLYAVDSNAEHFGAPKTSYQPQLPVSAPVPLGADAFKSPATDFLKASTTSDVQRPQIVPTSSGLSAGDVANQDLTNKYATATTPDSFSPSVGKVEAPAFRATPPGLRPEDRPVVENIQVAGGGKAAPRGIPSSRSESKPRIAPPRSSEPDADTYIPSEFSITPKDNLPPVARIAPPRPSRPQSNTPTTLEGEENPDEVTPTDEEFSGGDPDPVTEADRAKQITAITSAAAKDAGRPDVLVNQEPTDAELIAASKGNSGSGYEGMDPDEASARAARVNAIRKAAFDKGEPDPFAEADKAEEAAYDKSQADLAAIENKKEIPSLAGYTPEVGKFSGSLATGNNYPELTVGMTKAEEAKLKAEVYAKESAKRQQQSKEDLENNVVRTPYGTMTFPKAAKVTPRTEYDEAGTGLTSKQQDAADARAVAQANEAQQRRIDEVRNNILLGDKANVVARPGMADKFEVIAKAEQARNARYTGLNPRNELPEWFKERQAERPNMSAPGAGAGSDVQREVARMRKQEIYAEQKYKARHSGSTKGAPPRSTDAQLYGDATNKLANAQLQKGDAQDAKFTERERQQADRKLTEEYNARFSEDPEFKKAFPNKEAFAAAQKFFDSYNKKDTSRPKVP